MDEETKLYNENGSHDWLKTSAILFNKFSKQQELEVCRKCGLSNVLGAILLKCPPWASTDEGDTKTNRVYEAGVLKDRDIQPMDWEAIAIINSLAMNSLQLMANKREDLARKALLEIKGRIDQLIQKHEGHEQS